MVNQICFLLIIEKDIIYHFPRYWMNTEKYQLSQMAQAVVGSPFKMLGEVFGVKKGTGKTAFQDAMPRGQYYLDRRLNDCGTDKQAENYSWRNSNLYI